jgi:hypothetical protein
MADINVTEEIIDINVTEEVITIEAPTGAYPFPNAVYSVFGRVGAIVSAEGDYNLTQLGDVTLTSPANGQVLKYNGTQWVNSTDADTGITTLNTLTALSQTFATGTSGTDFNISSASSTHTFNFPSASATNRGLLTSADWSNFNTAYNDSITSAAVTGTTTKTLTLNQQDGGTITASWTDINTDAVTSVFGRTGAVTAQSGDYTTTQVTEGTNLYFTNTRAQNAITLTTTGTSGAATYSGGTLNIPQYQGVLTNPVTGTGTTNTLPKFTGTSAIGNSNITDTGSLITLGSITRLTGAGTFSTDTTVDTGDALMISSAGATAATGAYGSGLVFGGVGISANPKRAAIVPVMSTTSADTDRLGLAFFTHPSATGTDPMLEMMRLDPNGALGIGTTSLTARSLSVSKNLTGSTIGYNILSDGIIQSDVTSQAHYFTSVANTAASAFTLGTLYHYRAIQGTFGAGSTVSGQAGFWADASLIGATTNYGFFGNIPSGTNRYNLFMNGTAENYLAGDTGIGVSANLIASGPILTSTLTNGGSGYVDGTYVDVAVTTISAVGLYALYTIVVSGGIVTTATLTWGGIGYKIGNTISVSNTLLGGTGSGLIITVNTVDSSQLTISNINGADITLLRNDTSLSAGENIGTIKWSGNDNSSKASGIYAEIGAFAAGTSGGANLSFFTRSIVAGSSLVEAMRIDSRGGVGIGATILAGYSLKVSKGITNNITSYGIVSDGQIQSDVTTRAEYYRSEASTAAAAFTLPTIIHYRSQQTTFGAGSSVTNQYGFFADASMVGATNNYAFWGAIPSGTNRWNLYMNGTAANYLAAQLLIGTTTTSAFALDVNGTARVSGQLTLGSTISNGTFTYTLPSATGTLALTSDILYPVTSVFGRTGAVVATEGDYSLTQLSDVTITTPTNGQVLKYNGTAWVNDTDANTGTVTSVGLSSATSGVTIGSSPITTSGTITLSIATASGSQNGLLSSTDWTTFNNKQNALTNPVTGTGTTNTLPKFTAASTIGDSNITDNGSLINLNSSTRINSGQDGLRIGADSNGVINSANTSKRGRLNVPQYGNPASLPIAILQGATDAASNSIQIGGTQGGYALAADVISFFIGATYNATTATEIARFASNGALGIGSTSLTGVTLSVSKNMTGATGVSGIRNNGVIQSDVTGTAVMYNSIASTAAATFNNNLLIHYYAQQGGLGAGSSVTAQYGFFAEGSLISATLNYGFFGNIPAGTNRWNLFMNGTANNYMAGSLGIGSTALTNRSLYISKNITGGTDSVGISQDGIIQSDATSSARYNDTFARVQNTAFTLGNLFHYRAGSNTFGSATVTNQYGFYVDATAIGATNNYGFFGNIASGTNRWNLYMAGTAANYMAGDLGIGAIPGGARKLEIGLNDATTYTTTTLSNGLSITNTSATTNSFAGIFLSANPTTGNAARASINVIAISGGTGDLAFTTRNASVQAEKIRIKAQGQMRFVPLSADPSGAEAGDVYYNSTTNKLKVYNGTTWETITSA